MIPLLDSEIITSYVNNNNIKFNNILGYSILSVNSNSSLLFEPVHGANIDKKATCELNLSQVALIIIFGSGEWD